MKTQERDEKGRFKPKHSVGKSTRFALGHILSAKYDESYPEKMIRYFLDESIEIHTFEDFAHSLGVIAETLRNWTESHAHFRDAYAVCKEVAKQELLVGGLTEKYNPQIVKFLAINNHGMKEKIEQEVKGDAQIQVRIDVVD